MQSQRLGLSLTVINLILLVFLIGQTFRPVAAQEEAATEQELPYLRARGLEIVDDHGRTRALLAVMPPATVDGKDYPETVLLRLIDPKSGPVVKLTAAENGSALGLSDDADGGIQLFARDAGNRVTILGRNGKDKVNELK